MNKELEKQYELPKIRVVDEIKLGEITDVRKGAVLDGGTSVTVLKSKERDYDHFELVFHLPLKRNGILTLLKNFTDTPFKPSYVSELWSGYDGETNLMQNPVAGLVHMLQDRDPLMRRDGPGLANTLESEDDSVFISSLVKNIKTHSSAWAKLISGNEFVHLLSKNFRAEQPELMDYAGILKPFIEQFPTIPRIQKRRSATQLPKDKEVIIDGLNFAQQSANSRANFIEDNFATKFRSNASYLEFQKALISSINGIDVEFCPTNGETVYLLTGDEEMDLSKTSKSRVLVNKNRCSAKIEFDNIDGTACIFPKQSNFVIPAFSFDSFDYGRQKSDSLEAGTVINSISTLHNNGLVEVIHDFKYDQLNQLAGMLLMQNLFIQQKTEKNIPPEIMPFVAMENMEAVLKRKFFEKIENID